MKTIKKYLPEIEKNILSKNNKNSYIIKSIKLDKKYRIYTVFNLKQENIKNLELYGYSYIDNENKKFIKTLNDELGKIGLTELVGLTKVDKKTDTSILINIEYKFLDIGRFFKRIILFIIFLLSSILLYFFI